MSLHTEASEAVAHVCRSSLSHLHLHLAGHWAGWAGLLSTDLGHLGYFAGLIPQVHPSGDALALISVTGVVLRILLSFLLASSFFSCLFN